MKDATVLYMIVNVIVRIISYNRDSASIFYL